MAVVSYKCPNCDGPLVFRPEKNNFHCDFCGSDFFRQEAEDANKNAKDAEKTEHVEVFSDVVESEFKDISHDEAEDEQFEKEAATYSCPSCGAEIITAESTAATTCYYCHNPVILSGKLSREFRPDRLIPFTFPKEEAERRFREFCGKKKFLPKEFLAPGTFSEITGVYYPYFIVDAKVNGSASGKSKSVRTWVSGKYQYTETTVYQHDRSGFLDIDGIAVSAYKDGDRNLLKYVCPFDESQSVDFSMAYLSGFQAEKRQFEKDELKNDIMNQVRNISEAEFRSTMAGHGSISSMDLTINEYKDQWEYFLFPLWVLTCKYKGKLYRYALNGQTGKVYGELPIHVPKLLLTTFGMAAATFIVLFIMGGFLI
jgi:DNA-directed RNA polymerase subunit RPC12/RpoP